VSELRERELDVLMAKLADGDRTAFAPLFASLYPRALGLARMRLGAGDVDDAAQQALEKVFSRAREFTPGRPVLPWFYAIAANEIHALTRRRARLRSREVEAEGAEPVALAADAEAELIREELRASVRVAVEALDGPSAEAIRALLGEGPSPLGLERPALRKRVSRAYARLRVLLGARS
jgi:RNA polymerase sigma factor (sigma-70 family)